MTCLVAGSASAGTSYSMIGEWALNRGILVDIPINGGPLLCFAGDNELIPGAGTGDHGGCLGRGAGLPSQAAARFTWPRPATKVVAGFKAANGGIPGAAVITTTGTARSFTVPPGAFGQAPPSVAVTATVMLAPTVVQLNTTLGALGPPNLTQATMATAFGSPAPFTVQYPGKFVKDAWSKDPGQGNVLGSTLPASQVRPAATFTWCPSNPSCIFGTPAAAGTPNDPIGTTTGAAAGSVDGVIRYRAGANKFGGTMAMLLSGSGSTSVQFGTLMIPTPGTTMTLMGGAGIGRTMIPFIAHLPFGGVGAFMNPQVNGAGFAFTNTVMLNAAPLHLDFHTSMQFGTNGGVTTGGGSITTSGPTSTMGVPYGAAPGDSNLNFGFPWTTGAISIMNVELTPGGKPGTGTLTANGNDGRDGNGNGTITLVAGGTANRTLSGDDFESVEVLTMVFDDGTATPSMGPAGFTTVALLMALTAGFTLRKRFASEA
jgi:hypothetical protein